MPGVQAMSAAGHTIGDTIYIIKSGAKSLAFTGDISHHRILLTKRPKTEFSFDSDPRQAMQTRPKVSDMLAKDKIPFVSYQFPCPGSGNLARQGDGFRFYPTPMENVCNPPKKA